MKSYYIRIQREQSEEVKRNYPNLAKHPKFISVAMLNTSYDLVEMKDSKVKKVLEKHLDNKGMRTPEDYSWGKKETADVRYTDPDDKTEVFNGDVKIPERFRGDDPDTRIEKMVT